MTIAPLEFSPASPSAADEARLYTCVSGDPGLSLSLAVNTATDGTETGTWQYIHANGASCYNHDDANTWPRWETRALADGDHVVRATGTRFGETDVTKATYHLDRRRPADPTIVGPVPDVWLTNREVVFQWTQTLRAQSYRFLISENADPTQNPIVDRSLSSSATGTIVTLDDDYASLYWRLIATNEIGTAEVTRHFGIDRQLPSASVTGLQATQSNATFRVSWSGTDLPSGVRSFDLQYRDGPNGQWQFWLSNTNATAGTFVGVDGHTYYFRARATDLAGNASEFAAGDGDTSTTVNLDPAGPPGGITRYGDGSDGDLNVSGNQYADDIRTVMRQVDRPCCR
jgi:hypothetical protein